MYYYCPILFIFLSFFDAYNAGNDKNSDSVYPNIEAAKTGKYRAPNALKSTNQSQECANLLKNLLQELMINNNSTSVLWREKLRMVTENADYKKVIMDLFYLDTGDKIAYKGSSTTVFSKLLGKKARLLYRVTEFVSKFAESHSLAETGLALFLKHFLDSQKKSSKMTAQEIESFVNEFYSNLHKGITEKVPKEPSVQFPKAVNNRTKAMLLNANPVFMPKPFDQMTDEERIDFFVQKAHANGLRAVPEPIAQLLPGSRHRGAKALDNDVDAEVQAKLIQSMREEDELLTAKLREYRDKVGSFLGIERGDWHKVDDNLFRFNLSWEQYYDIIAPMFNVMRDPASGNSITPVTFPTVSTHMDEDGDIERPAHEYERTVMISEIQTLFKLISRPVPNDTRSLAEKWVSAIGCALMIVCHMRGQTERKTVKQSEDKANIEQKLRSLGQKLTSVYGRFNENPVGNVTFTNLGPLNDDDKDQLMILETISKHQIAPFTDENIKPVDTSAWDIYTVETTTPQERKLEICFNQGFEVPTTSQYLLKKVSAIKSKYRLKSACNVIKEVHLAEIMKAWDFRLYKPLQPYVDSHILDVALADGVDNAAIEKFAQSVEFTRKIARQIKLIRDAGIDI